MTGKAESLAQAGRTVLESPDPAQKCALTRDAHAQWQEATPFPVGASAAPDRPARPARPELLAPAQVPRRRVNRGTAGRIALLHALAHIELNAVDLAWDLIVRFSGEDLPRAFFGDWLGVAAEEARHFTLLQNRLHDFGASYGDLPAHDGLWDAAVETRHDLAARLAIVPLVLEARGLDVTPVMIGKLRSVEDDASADALEVIYREEVGHVRIGRHWFEFECARRGRDAESYWQDLVRRHFRGGLKRPFNVPARDRAGFPQHWYDTVPAV